MTEYVKLKPEVLDLWTEALESGEYAQTTGWLHRLKEYEDEPGGWCCLGVLCDVASKAGVEMVRETNGFAETFDAYGGGMPESVRKWAFGDVPTERAWDVEDHLITMNDSEGARFPAISTWIKANLA